jgi:DNA-binding transcriptional LysR family regulator
VTAAAPLRGFGLGMAPLWQIRDLVEEGLLEVILEEFEAAKFPIHAVFPPTRMPIAKTRALIDVLAQGLERARLGQ